MAIIGYARVSSSGQSLDVQLEKLKDCDRIYQEKKSARTDAREQLQLALDYVRDGDVFVITKLDRLARSTRDLLNIISRLETKGVHFKVLDQNIDTSTPSGKLMVNILASISEFENDLRRERQADGIALAKSRGIPLGRKAKLSAKDVSRMCQMRQDGFMIRELMSSFNLSKASVYRLMADAPALAA